MVHRVDQNYETLASPTREQLRVSGLPWRSKNSSSHPDAQETAQGLHHVLLIWLSPAEPKRQNALVLSHFCDGVSHCNRLADPGQSTEDDGFSPCGDSCMNCINQRITSPPARFNPQFLVETGGVISQGNA